MDNYGIVAAWSKTYATTTAADIDLAAASQITSGSAGTVVRQTQGLYLVIGGAGYLHVQYANGNTDYFPVYAGQVLPPARYSKILHDTSTAANVTAYFA